MNKWFERFHIILAIRLENPSKKDPGPIFYCGPGFESLR